MREQTVRSQDFAQYVPYDLTRSSSHLGWNGFRVEIVRGHSAGEISLPPLDHHLLNLIVSVPTRHQHRWGSADREDTAQEGAAALVPAGQESYWRWNYLAAGTPCDFHLHLDPAFVRRVAVVNLDQLPRDGEFHGDLCFFDPALQSLAHLLLDETERDGVHGALYAESLVTSLVTLLLGLQQPWRRSLAPIRPSAAAQRVRLAVDYIETHLGDNLHLEQIGEVAGLGPDRLGEFFRAALGVSPYHYVLQRRIDRAKQFLRDSTSSITAIALRLGFADHAHFSATFRKSTGQTPSRFRSESRR